jgi:ribosomal protein L12E/L44/L45/RPP1/RPP2
MTWSLANRRTGPRSGENAATALENNLTTLESKIDELLASFERPAAALPPSGSANGTGTSGASDGGGSQDAANK